MPEFFIELENAYKKKVRIYCITSSLKEHSKNFQYGIMREKSKIYSTFILVDHKTKPKGVWFNGGILSTNNPDFILNLNKKQINDLAYYFNKEFWNAGGQEIFFNDIRITLPLEDNLNDILYAAEDVIFNDFSILDKFEIQKLVLPEKRLENFNYHLYSKILFVKLDKSIKDLILDLNLLNTKLFAASSIKFGYMELSNIKRNINVIFDWDCGIILDNDQLLYIKGRLPLPEWQYHSEKKIEEINNEIILKDDNWDNPNPLKIKAEGVIDIGKQYSNDIEQWVNNLPEPKDFKYKEYYKKVSFTWLLFPPTLLKDAKKHKLYDLWNNFEKRIKNRIDKDIKEMESFIDKLKLPYLKETKKIINKSKIQDLINELNKIKVEELKFMSDIADVKDEVEKVKNIKQKFLDIIDQCLLEIKNSKMEEEDSIEKMNEKEKNRLKEIEKLRKDETNELSEIVKLNKKKEELEVPPRILPKVGTLYEHNNHLYLLIEYIEEIELAIKVAKEYDAKVVAKIGE
jgi:hypothetical protein